MKGDIPPEIGLLSRLEFLRVYLNVFTGCVPAGLLRVPDSDTMDLRDKDLDWCAGTVGRLEGGTVQAEIGNAIRLDVNAYYPITLQAKTLRGVWRIAALRQEADNWDGVFRTRP